ncbi:HNH endonuclease [candidate division WOR_3 bacterium SM1_77]|jgi:5-methylcytosine-specific restriction endonuclease McrA|uniref:HNH endonuclease n=1 Tax=candidate division WOR_3 bacterium SM1_77 TaxID=1703778 RepID=A0A0S8JUQ7_UNCW3|nr:MAG: HNH endonuclease [candidate division WOR_3 bacterium SM1_77]
MLQIPVLLLNQNYEPLTILKLKRAITLVILGKVDMIENEDGKLLHAISLTYRVPSVIRLKYFVRIKRKEISLTKKNVIKRDNHQCQYCGKRTGLMTADHILPKAVGGEESWENLICACHECNNKKGDRSLKQAGMRLLKKPKRPSYFTFVLNEFGMPNAKWRPFLFQC